MSDPATFVFRAREVLEYVLMDPRAHDDVDRASVYVYCEDLAEALREREDFPDAVLVEMSGPNNDTALTVVPWPEVRRG